MSGPQDWRRLGVVEEVQLVGGVEVLAAGEVAAVHKVDQLRVGLEEEACPGVARCRFHSLSAEAGVQQQRMSPPQLPFRATVGCRRHAAGPVGCQQAGDGRSRQPGLVHQRDEHMVPRGGRGDSEPEGAPHPAGPVRVVDDPVPAEVGAGTDGCRVRAEHRHHFPAAAREQHVRQHLHKRAVSEPEQRLGPEPQPCPGAGGQQHRRRACCQAMAR